MPLGTEGALNVCQTGINAGSNCISTGTNFGLVIRCDLGGSADIVNCKSGPANTTYTMECFSGGGTQGDYCKNGGTANKSYGCQAGTSITAYCSTGGKAT